MKMLLLSFILIMFTASLAGPPSNTITIPVKVALTPFKMIIGAIAKVETNNDSTAIGDKNLKLHSYGKYQIRQSRLDDFNQKTGKHYTIRDMFDNKKAEEVFYFYCTTSDLEVIARLWNGGPRAMQKKSTVKYWKLVKAQL